MTDKQQKHLKYSAIASILYILLVMYIVQGEAITMNGRAGIAIGFVSIVGIVNLAIAE